jgi:hypothetical protein
LTVYNLLYQDIIDASTKFFFIQSAVVPATSVAFTGARGEYTLSYFPQKVGTYYGVVKVNGLAIRGERELVVTIYPGPVMSSTTGVVGGAIPSAVAGNKLYFQIQPKDAFFNDVSFYDVESQAPVLSRINGSSSNISTVSFIGGGLYGAAYRATIAQSYSIAITWSGVHIQGSPFTVDVLPGPTDPTTVTVTALPPVQSWDGRSISGLSQAVAGVSSRFQVTARDYFGNLRRPGNRGAPATETSDE